MVKGKQNNQIAVV